jgi:hypothetical protein
MNTRALWDIVPCSLVEVNRRFRSAYYLYYPFNEFIVLVMEVVRTCETSVYFNETTWLYIPEVFYLLSRCYESI